MRLREFFTPALRMASRLTEIARSNPSAFGQKCPKADVLKGRERVSDRCLDVAIASPDGASMRAGCRLTVAWREFARLLNRF